MANPLASVCAAGRTMVPEPWVMVQLTGIAAMGLPTASRAKTVKGVVVRNCARTTWPFPE